MVVPSMTIREIQTHLLQDQQENFGFIEQKQREFKRECLTVASHFPYSRCYKKVTRNGNRFFISFTALKRGNFKAPYIAVYSIYPRREGYYAAALVRGLMVLYSPHFFQRYRERILKNKDLDHIETIKRYFEMDWGFEGCVLEDDRFDAAYHCFEDDAPAEKISCAAANSQGYCFIEKQGNIFIVKTIISEEMLFDDQKELFHKLKHQYDLQPYKTY